MKMLGQLWSQSPEAQVKGASELSQWVQGSFLRKPANVHTGGVKKGIRLDSKLQELINGSMIWYYGFNPFLNKTLQGMLIYM